MGNVSFGRSITASLRCSFLLTLFPCPSVGLLHKLQPFRLNLLQHRVLHRLQCACLPHYGLFHGLLVNLCSGVWSTSLSFSETDAHRDVYHFFLPSFFFFFFSHSSLLVQYFHPFLNTFSQRHRSLGWQAQLCLAMDQLEPAGTGCVQHGAALTSLHRGHPTPSTSSAWVLTADTMTQTLWAIIGRRSAKLFHSEGTCGDKHNPRVWRNTEYSQNLSLTQLKTSTANSLCSHI